MHDLYRLFLPLHRYRSPRCHDRIASELPACDVTQQHCVSPWRGQRFYPLGRVDRVACDRVGQVFVRAEIAHHDLTVVNADADEEWDRKDLSQRIGNLLDAIDHRQGAGRRMIHTVTQGGRRTKGDEDLVTHELVDHTSMHADHLCHHLVVGVEQGDDAIGWHRLADGGEAAQIAEQQGDVDLLAMKQGAGFSFETAAYYVLGAVPDEEVQCLLQFVIELA